MKKYTFIILLFFSCNSNSKRTINIDSNSVSILKTIIDSNQYSCMSIDLKKKIFINSSEITRYYSCENYIYLVQGGWKGNTYGILVLRDSTFLLPTLCFDYEEIKFKINSKAKFYYCSSKVL